MEEPVGDGDKVGGVTRRRWHTRQSGVGGLDIAVAVRPRVPPDGESWIYRGVMLWSEIEVGRES